MVVDFNSSVEFNQLLLVQGDLKLSDETVAHLFILSHDDIQGLENEDAHVGGNYNVLKGVAY